MEDTNQTKAPASNNQSTEGDFEVTRMMETRNMSQYYDSNMPDAGKGPLLHDPQAADMGAPGRGPSASTRPSETGTGESSGYLKQGMRSIKNTIWSRGSTTKDGQFNKQEGSHSEVVTSKNKVKLGKQQEEVKKTEADILREEQITQLKAAQIMDEFTLANQ